MMDRPSPLPDEREDCYDLGVKNARGNWWDRWVYYGLGFIGGFVARGLWDLLT